MIFSNILILTIDPRYQSNILESLDTELIYKERPYYVELEYSKNYRILLPLRSNCRLPDYTIPIVNDSNRLNPGIDCSKMLILSIEEAKLYTRPLTKMLNDKVYMDIVQKKKRIQKTMNKTLSDYKSILHKKRNGLDLSAVEKELYIRSTLKNYENFVNNYSTKQNSPAKKNK